MAAPHAAVRGQRRGLERKSCRSPLDDGRIDPVALAFERIGRQRNPTSVLVGIESIPINGHPFLPKRANCEEKCDPFGVVLARVRECRDGRATPVWHEVVSRQRAQRGARATFQEEIVVMFDQPLHGLGELHSREGMVRPVPGIRRLCRRNRLSGHCRYEWPRRPTQLDLGHGTT